MVHLILTGVLRCGTVCRLKYGVIVTKVCARREAKSADALTSRALLALKTLPPHDPTVANLAAAQAILARRKPSKKPSSKSLQPPLIPGF